MCWFEHLASVGSNEKSTWFKLKHSEDIVRLQRLLQKHLSAAFKMTKVSHSFQAYLCDSCKGIIRAHRLVELIRMSRKRHDPLCFPQDCLVSILRNHQNVIKGVGLQNSGHLSFRSFWDFISLGRYLGGCKLVIQLISNTTD